MTKEEAIMIIGNIPINPLTVDECYSISQYQEAKTMAIEALENQKTGHWKKISPAGIMECSVCGGNVLTSDIEAYKYCHHCGSKMVESPEESDEDNWFDEMEESEAEKEYEEWIESLEEKIRKEITNETDN